MIRKSLIAALAASAITAFSTAAHAQERYLGEIFAVGYNFCPRGTAAAEGQILPISTNQALFSLFGTMYGGDGRVTFALPDLRGRSIISAGAGAGLTNYTQGQTVGSESHAHSGGSAPRKTQPTGGGSEASSRPPQLTLRYCVVLQGIYPSRN